MSVTALTRCLVWVCVLGLVALAAEPAGAVRSRRANLVLEGYVGQAPAGVRPQAQLVLQAGGKSYDFALTRTAVITGNRSRNQLLQDIRPGGNALILRGPESVLRVLTGAPPGQQLRISGYHQAGARDLTVTRIAPASPGAPPATAQP